MVLVLRVRRCGCVMHSSCRNGVCRRFCLCCSGRTQARHCWRRIGRASGAGLCLPPLASAGKGGARRRRKGRNLALRLHARRDATLRFLTDPEVPFTNNEAERDLRMMKLRQKISGGFRSANGAEEFAILRTIIATAQKQGRDILDALTSPAERLRPNRNPASTRRPPTCRADTECHALSCFPCVRCIAYSGFRHEAVRLPVASPACGGGPGGGLPRRGRKR